MKHVLLAAAVLLAACATSGTRREVRTVDAAGWAVDDPTRPASTQRRALADGLRRAVESAAGVSLSARTRLRDGTAVSERVVTSAVGCVLEYRLLETSRVDGGVSVRLRVRVSSDARTCAGRESSSLDIGLETDVAVERAGGADEDDALLDAVCATLRGRLAGGGWRIVDRSPSVRWIADARSEDVRDLRLGPLAGARARVSLRILSAPEGRLLVESATEASAVGFDAASARRAAGERAAELSFSRAVKSLEANPWMLDKSN